MLTGVQHLNPEILTPGLLNLLSSMRPFRRRQWQPTPVCLPGKSHGWGSLVGCSPWSCEESDMTEWFHFHFYALEKEMATHSSALAWRIPGMVEPSRLLSMGSHRVGHDLRELAAAAAAVCHFPGGHTDSVITRSKTSPEQGWPPDHCHALCYTIFPLPSNPFSWLFF